MKTEPVYVINKRPKNLCTRCGLEFSQSHLSLCSVKTEKCRSGGGIGHVARMCKKPKRPTLEDRPENQLLAEGEE